MGVILEAVVAFFVAFAIAILVSLLPGRWREWFSRNRWRYAVVAFGTFSVGLAGIAIALVISPFGDEPELGLALSGGLALAMAGFAIYAYVNRHDY